MEHVDELVKQNYVVIMMHGDGKVSLHFEKHLRDVEIFCDNLPETESPIIATRRFVVLP